MLFGKTRRTASAAEFIGVVVANHDTVTVLELPRAFAFWAFFVTLALTGSRPGRLLRKSRAGDSKQRR